MTKFKFKNCGEWDSEPDELDWKYGKLQCHLRRSEATGAWCGYVMIPRDHPLYENVDEAQSLEVHGGVTYTGEGIRDTEGWLIGFDCGHCCDIVPFLEMPFEHTAEYRDLNYAKRETENLAKQIKEFTNSSNDIDQNGDCK